MKYPDPARCRFPGARTIDPPTCHCGRPLARVELRFTAPDGRRLTDSYWRHVPARNPKRPGDLAGVGERTWTGYVGALSSPQRELCPPASERGNVDGPQVTSDNAGTIGAPVDNRGVGAGGRIPLYADLDALHAAGFGARP